MIFIPHAGGCGESYMPWFRHCPHEVDCRYLRLPARGARGNEAMPDSIEQLADAALQALDTICDKQIAFFGHSMGGLIAFELARKMEICWRKPARALFVSGCRAPGEPLTRCLSGLDDELFIRQLAGLGGTETVLLEQPALLRLFLSTLRQDIALCERYAGPPPAPLQTPIHVIWGTEDDLITDVMIDSWRKFSTEGNVFFYPHQGDHFYHQQQSASVCSIIYEKLNLD
ncbi:thioesterase II family protein [Erwinia amylovora]|uniref:thioesterase II family protein n=1 Tax=Erwinia amylovora TaxID=552 RepID=UPI00237A9AD1|nr:alpha/beta fold hydrolase [Erwinia amylovora]